MKIDITATIKEIGQIESFGDNGFQKRNLILTEQSGEYENLFCFEFSGDKITEPERYQVGQVVKVGGFINCREWNGKYFTSLRGSFVQTAGEVGQAPQPQQPQAPAFGSAEHAQAQIPVQQSPQPVNAVAPQPVQQPVQQPQQIPAGYAPPPIQQPVAQPQQIAQPQAGDIPF